MEVRDENLIKSLEYNIKICGMREGENIKVIASLLPDYLGFIFYKKSARYFEGIIPEISKSIKKTGVFVNETIDVIFTKISQYDLQAVQLHGKESPEFVRLLRNEIGDKIEIIKAFAVDYDFNFERIKDFENHCDYFLFDTKGKLPGGNGEKFDWNLLSKYTSTKSIFLSGGIGMDDLENFKNIKKINFRIQGFDFNSKLELKPGLKSTELAKNVIQEIRKL
ncbi:MAG: phosphoribosylanthranilate isomerase [Flavobacterium sp.]